jgi:hypothetical protein
MRSRTSCLLARNNLPKGAVHCFRRTEVRQKIGVDRDDLAGVTLDMVPSTRTAPKSLVVDLRHFLQRLIAWISLLLHTVVVRKVLQRAR